MEIVVHFREGANRIRTVDEVFRISYKAGGVMIDYRHPVSGATRMFIPNQMIYFIEHPLKDDTE